MENEENQENIPQEEKDTGYKPRPAWQVWAARAALVVFILFLIVYYINIFGGR